MRRELSTASSSKVLLTQIAIVDLDRQCTGGTRQYRADVCISFHIDSDLGAQARVHCRTSGLAMNAQDHLATHLIIQREVLALIEKEGMVTRHS